MTGAFNHLWQSSAFTAMVALAAWLLRQRAPRTRYWLWLAASLKFLLPFSLLVSTGAQVRLPPDTPSLGAVTVQRLSTYFAPMPEFTNTNRGEVTSDWAVSLSMVWLVGSLFLLLRRYRQWRTIRGHAHRAKRLPYDDEIPVFSSEGTMEPGVFGTFHPVLLLPEGLADALTPGQLRAIVVHEQRHIRYRDNLSAAIHMCAEAMFWFHPLIWWIGAKLIEERERDCDEAVLAQGGSPAEYARGILQVCQSCAASPLPCVAGIGGSDLKKRIEEIMTWRGSLPLPSRGRAALTLAAAVAIFVPVILGIVRGQSLPPAPVYAYAVVSIHRSARADAGWQWETGPQHGLRVINATALELLEFAYQIPDYRISGAPGWASSEHYDITLTPAEPEIGESRTANASEMARRSRNWQRLQAVLRDRFSLILRVETRELPVYTLVQSATGIKFSRTDGQPSSFMGPRGRLTATAQRMGRLATFLSAELSRPVMDETGLDGQYDFKLEWDPSNSAATPIPDGASNPLAGLSLMTALKEQMGLRLVSKKGPVQVYAVEKLERPGEN